MKWPGGPPHPDRSSHLGAGREKVVDELQWATSQRVHGKTTLIQNGGNSLEQPNGVVKSHLYPVVGGQTLSDLVEYRSNGPLPASYRHHPCRASYNGHYRHYAPTPCLTLWISEPILAPQRPIIKALALIKANRDSRQQHFAVDGTVPIEGVVPPHWRELVLGKDASGERRVNRINFEISVIRSLREACAL